MAAGFHGMQLRPLGICPVNQGDIANPADEYSAAAAGHFRNCRVAFMPVGSAYAHLEQLVAGESNIQLPQNLRRHALGACFHAGLQAVAQLPELALLLLGQSHGIRL